MLHPSSKPLALDVGPAAARPHWPGPMFLAALGHVHLRLPAPHLHPPHHHENFYFETARMGRLMDHL